MRILDAIRTFPRRLGGITLWQLVKGLALAAVALVLFLFGGLLAASFWPNSKVPLREPVHDIVYLDQGWGQGRDAPSRQTFYYTPQGTSIKGLRYSWFVNLERPWSAKRFADPDHMREYGFLVDLQPSAANPHQLPVGFTRRFAGELQDDVLDLTCAACHTGQLNAWKDGQRIAIRIDGGEAMHAFTDMKLGDFLPDLILSMTATYVNPFKFNRFARNVLGAEHYADGKKALRSEFYAVLATFVKQGWNDLSKNLYPVAEGYGRTDALGRISNTVFGDHISPANYRKGDAPVSYPPVWDIWKFDWVQYGASVRHPLARNVGEGMGVGATYSLLNNYGSPIPAPERYQASTMIENLYQIEKTLWWLAPPKWPDGLLGKIDCKRAIYGKALFRQYCVKCHGPRLGDASSLAVDAPCKTHDTHWIVPALKASDIGTDPKTADNFANNVLDLTPTGLTANDARQLVRPLLEENLNRELALLKPGSEEWNAAKSAGEVKIGSTLDSIDMRKVPIGFGLNYFGLLIRQQYRKDPRFVPADRYPPGRGVDDGYFGEIDIPEAPPVYKARPLAGIWATPPFLHNGSVPNLYQLLLPAGKRIKTFLTGTKDFDVKNVGYVLKPLTERGFVFDTAIAGNSNSGHEFSGTAGSRALPPTGAACVANEDAQTVVIDAKDMPPPRDGVLGPEFTDEQRWAIIEYLKVHRNNPGADEYPDYCHCAGTRPAKEPEVKIPECPAGEAVKTAAWAR
ncbi:MAG TPA: di-heme-cytochrome C peroxidase [Bryobacteraceae bacterium]|nr:di-heme-cytochrome C peroxidase [Bryobacteraceae bacterium]